MRTVAWFIPIRLAKGRLVMGPMINFSFHLGICSATDDFSLTTGNVFLELTGGWKFQIINRIVLFVTLGLEGGVLGGLGDKIEVASYYGLGWKGGLGFGIAF